MNFCSHCGNKLKRQIPSGDTNVRDVCLSCNTIHYQNPKVIVGIVPIFENKILLCKRSIEPRSGYWTIPSGFMENGETLSEGALREAKEEAHIDATIDYLHTVYSLPKINQIYFLYCATIKTPSFRAGNETSEVRLFSLSDIPWESIAFSAVTFALQGYIENIKTDQPLLHEGFWNAPPPTNY